MAGATIPTARDITRVNPTTPSAVQSTPDQHGAQVGRAMSEFGQAGFDLAITVRDNTEKAEGNDINRKMSAYARLLEVGGKDEDGTEIIGYRSLKGKAAVDAHDEYVKKLDARRQQLLGSASSDRVRRMAGPAVENKYNVAAHSLSLHQVNAAAAYKKTTSEAMRTELEQQAIANSTNWDKTVDVVQSDGSVKKSNVVQDSIEALGKEAFKQAVAEGAEPKAAASLAQTEMSEARIKVLEDLKARDPALAEAYLKDLLRRERETEGLKKGDLVNPDAVTKFRDSLSTSKRLVLAQTTVDDLAIKHKGLKTPEDIAKAREEYRKKYSGKDREAIRAQFERVIAENKRMETMALNDAKATINRHVLGRKPLSEVDPKLLDLVSQDPQYMQYITNLPTALAQSNFAGQFSPTPQKAATERLNHLLLAVNSDELAATDPESMRNVLTVRQFSKLEDAHKSETDRRNLIQGESGPIYKRTESFLKKIATELAIGELRDTKDAESTALYGELRRDLTDYIVRETAAGHVPTDKEIKAEITRSLVRIEADPPGFRGGNVKFKGDFVFKMDEMTKEQRAHARIDRETRTRHGLDRRVHFVLKEKGVPEGTVISEDHMASLAAILFTKDEVRLNKIINRLKNGPGPAPAIRSPLTE